MGLFDRIKTADTTAVPIQVDRISVAIEGIKLAENQLAAQAAFPPADVENTPPGVFLLRLARNSPSMDENRKALFLEAMMELPNEHVAALRAGVTVIEARRAKREDPQFAGAVEHAAALATGAAEGEAWRRAVKGVEKQVWFQGAPVGTEQIYSDTLLTKVLAANEPRYEPKSHVTADVNTNVNWFELVNAMKAAKEDK